MYDKICSNCGRKLSEFINDGMLSCPECYANFNDEIKAVCKKMHGRILHAGKSPKFQGVDRELLIEYQQLIAERERAGIEGDFKKMASLSEQILDVKQTLQDRGVIK